MRWPVEYAVWRGDFSGNITARATWRVYDPHDLLRPQQVFGLGCTIALADAETEAGRLSVQAFNRCLENVRRRHGFPQQMIEWAVRAPASRARWQRTADGGYQPYWPRADSDAPPLIGFAYPPETG